MAVVFHPLIQMLPHLFVGRQIGHQLDRRLMEFDAAMLRDVFRHSFHRLVAEFGLYVLCQVKAALFRSVQPLSELARPENEARPVAFGSESLQHRALLRFGDRFAVPAVDDDFAQALPP